MKLNNKKLYCYEDSNIELISNLQITIYTSCCNVNKGIYYYTTYDNHQITAVDMYKENLDSNVLIRYPLIKEEQIRTQN